MSSEAVTTTAACQLAHDADLVDLGDRPPIQAWAAMTAAAVRFATRTLPRKVEALDELTAGAPTP